MIRILPPFLIGCAALSIVPAVGRAGPLASSSTPMMSEASPRLEPGRQRTLYLEVIEGLRKDGRAHAALAHLDAYDAAYPKDAKAQILRADCLADIEDYAAAEVIYRKQIAGAVGDQAQAGLGRMDARRGDWAAAAADFAGAVKRRATHAPYLNDLGYALVMAGRSEEGMFRLRQASELSPNDPMIRNNLIVALARGGRADDAARMIAEIADPAERQRVKAMAATPAPTVVASAPASPPTP